MSTNCTVSMIIDGKVVSVYGHWDGYLEGVGATLNNHYLDRDSIMDILDNGSFSSLDQQSCIAPPGHSFSNPVDGYSVFYRRDRGEENSNAIELDSLEELNRAYPSAEYDYVFVDGEGWYYRQRFLFDGFRKLNRVVH